MKQTGQGTPNEKAVFVSYAHRDRASVNFVPRLVASLDMYLDAFWDQKLQAGSWEPQIIEKIKECDCLLVAMSQPQSASEWCKKEYDAARECGKTIVPLRIHIETDFVDEKLKALQWANFTDDFDAGFRRLTGFILSEPVSSWEYLHVLDDVPLIRELIKGTIPGLIAREFADWLTVERLWPAFCADVDRPRRVFHTPRTTRDIARAFDLLKDQIAEDRDFLGLDRLEKASEIVNRYLSNNSLVNDRDHKDIGEQTGELTRAVTKYLEGIILSKRDFLRLPDFSATYWFDTASKLRELIIAHSRRSRYLY